MGITALNYSESVGTLVQTMKAIKLLPSVRVNPWQSVGSPVRASTVMMAIIIPLNTTSPATKAAVNVALDPLRRPPVCCTNSTMAE